MSESLFSGMRRLKIRDGLSEMHSMSCFIDCDDLLHHVESSLITPLNREEGGPTPTPNHEDTSATSGDAPTVGKPRRKCRRQSHDAESSSTCHTYTLKAMYPALE